MKRWLLLAAGAELLLVSCETESRTPTQPTSLFPEAQQEHGHVAPLFAIGLREPPRAPQPAFRGSATISYHGGPIITAQKVAAIYWSSRAIYNGGPTPGTSGPGSNDGSLVGFLLNHLGGSPYYGINTTYDDGGGTHVQNSVTYTQYWASNTNVPAESSTVSHSAVQAQIEAGFTNGNLTFDPSTLYLVFSDATVNLGGGFVPHTNGYCGRHSFFSWNGNVVKYAEMPHAFDINERSNDSGFTCGPVIDSLGSPNNDSAADVEVSVTAHEIEETNTDPQLSAWYDDFQNENADKCAYIYGPRDTLANGAVANMNLGGKDFLVQQNWEVGTIENCATFFDVATLSVSPNPVSICLNGVSTLTGTAIDQIGNVWSAGTVGWSSSDPTIAPVTPNGTRQASVSGSAAGQATITATLNGVTGTSSATVGTCLTPPTNCQLQWIQPPANYLKVTWTNSEGSASTEVEILKDGGSWTLVGTQSPGITSYFYTLGSQTGLFYARVRHIEQGFLPSPYCNTGAVTVG